MIYHVYVKGYKFHYSANEIDFTRVNWSTKEVILLKNPKEVYEESLYSDLEECKLEADVLIPQDQISHIVVFTDKSVDNHPTQLT